jgi:UDP:flavonoid glycosyltransferase YjiC (YdhE family)
MNRNNNSSRYGCKEDVLAKFVVAASPVPGHVGPMLNVVRTLVGAGHEVVVNTGERFRRQALATGARFVPLMGGAAFDYQELAAAPRRMNLQPGPEMMRFSIERVFANPIPDQARGIEAILREFPADAILTDTIFLGTLPFASRPREQRPALVRCGTTVLTLGDPAIAPFGVGLPLAFSERDLERYAALKLQLREQFIDFSNAVVNRKVVEAGGAELSSDFLDAMVTEMDLNLQFTVPSFEYPRTAMPENVRFVGAMLPPPTTQFERPEWWGELESGRPVVVVTQGTVANIDLGHLMGPTLAGLAEQDVLVIAATGGPSADAVPGPKPANARIVDFLPFDKLLPYASVLVTNGGYGAVNHALSLGIPVVGAGKTEDKAEVTARLEWAGVGINLNTAMPSPMMVRDAVRRILDYPDIYTAALELQAEYAGYDARHKVLTALDEVVGLGLFVGPREIGPREIHAVRPRQRKLWAVGGGR